MRTALFLAAALASSAAFAQTATPVETNISGASATIIDGSGANVGSANMRATPSGLVVITVSVTGLTPGWHGLHIHETGKCEPETEFKSAGGHLADGKQHGVLVEGGPHPGDLPNQMVQDDGVLVADIFTDRLTAGLIFDSDGSSIMIHSGRDDYQSQPAGDAGSRVACGVIEAAK